MKIIGIDPGLSGAIAVLENNKILNVFEMPVMAEGKKNKRQLNSAQLVNLIKENINSSEEVAVVVEHCFKNISHLLVHISVAVCVSVAVGMVRVSIAMRASITVVIGYYFENIAHPTGPRFGSFGSGVRFGSGSRWVLLEKYSSPYRCAFR